MSTTIVSSTDVGERKKQMLENVANEGVKNVKAEAENALKNIQKAERGNKNTDKIFYKYV